VDDRAESRQWNENLVRTLFSRRLRVRVGMELVFDFFADDREVIRRLHPDANDALRDANDGYRDILADENLLADFSGEY
jgi:hypothetical protein